MKCNYCDKKIDKPYRIGPGLNFCNTECYLKNCIKSYPGTSLENMARKMLEVESWM